MRHKKENRVIGHIKSKIDAFFGVLNPKGYVCIGCGNELKESEREHSLCIKCTEALPYRTGTCCDICGDYVNMVGLCSRCRTVRPSYDKAYAPFEYSGVIRKMILSYKDGDAAYLCEYICKYLVEYYNAMELSADFIAFVPSTSSTIKRRGFDHLKKLAETFATSVQLPLYEVLTRKSHSKDQTKLNYTERFEQVSDCFALAEEAKPSELQGKTCLLLDDVLTTGATASACAKTLKKYGVSVVKVLTLAR